MNLKLIPIFPLTTALMLLVGCGGESQTPVAIAPTMTSTLTVTPAPEPTATEAPNIELINYSSYPTEDIEEWIALAESKMKSRKSRIFAFIYPVGKMNKPEKRIRSDYADRVFREHEVLLSQGEIEFILGEIELWLQGDSCLSSGDEKQALSDYRTWLEKGADASTMHGLCERTRIVMMAIPEDMRDHQPLENFQYFLVHEFYHAFQQDLEDEGECQRKREEAADNSNSVWMSEGGAHYFSTWLLAEIHGRKDYRSQILEDGKRAFEGLDGLSNRLGWDIEPTMSGAASLSLMIEHGIITEESILDGSLFHNCARELEFDHSSPEMQHIKNSWYLIEQNGGVFQFKQEGLPISTPTPPAVPTATPTPIPSVKLINYSSYQTEDIEEWIALAESKMNNRKARIFVAIYPLGEMNKPEKRIIETDYASGVFREHKVLLSADEIETILGKVESWLDGDSCVHPIRELRAISDYRVFLERGADVGSQQALCKTTRTVMMSIRPLMRDYEPIEDFHYFLVHEMYHAFQQDLDDRGECLEKQNASRNRNSVWMYEGGAHYFAKWLVAEVYGTSNYRSQILKEAKETFERSGQSPDSLYTEGPDKTGAAALSLMIEHDMITEESILDGSLFHNCARELEFDHSSPEMQHIKNSWYLIEQKNGITQFKQEALATAVPPTEIPTPKPDATL